MTSKVRLLFCLLVVSVGSFTVNAQESKPSWVLLEEGRRLLSETTYSTPDIGRAISLLREALFLRGLYPEAELMLAGAYAVEGNLALERMHLESARKQKDDFRTQADYLETVYRLAEIAELEGQTAKALEYYREIAFRNPTYRTAFDTDSLAKFNELFLERQRGREGFELIFNLYRFPYDNSIKAHGELSRIYYLAGAYDLSINHALFAMVGWLSRTFDMIQYFEPDFEFTDMRTFMAKAKEYSDARSSLAETSFWTTYVYLANAVYALNPSENHPVAFEIWRQIAELTSDPLARQIASKQIQNPTTLKEIVL